MTKYYLGWLAPLSLFDSGILEKRLKARPQCPMCFNPDSLHLTFEEVLVPCKAIVVACDEDAAWTTIEDIFLPAEIRRRFIRVWDSNWQQQFEGFTSQHGFRRADE